MSDDLLERLGRGCNCGRCKLDLCCCAAMEEAKAEIEKLREALKKNAAMTAHEWQMFYIARAALGETK